MKKVFMGLGIMPVEDLVFASCLINKRVKEPYTWYELRYAIERHASTVFKKYIDEDDYGSIYYSIWSYIGDDVTKKYREEWLKERTGEIVEQIVKNDETIILDDLVSQRIVLAILKDIKPLNKV